MKIAEARKLKPGDEVFWNDPDGGVCSRTYKVKSVEFDGPYVTIEDVDGSVLDCYARELEWAKT